MTEKTVVLTVGAAKYTFRWDELTAAIARRVRAATGMSLLAAGRLMDGDIDIDVVATFCFAGALQAGSGETFAEIESAIDYQTEITVEFVEDDSPEV